MGYFGTQKLNLLAFQILENHWKCWEKKSECLKNLLGVKNKFLKERKALLLDYLRTYIDFLMGYLQEEMDKTILLMDHTYVELTEIVNLLNRFQMKNRYLINDDFHLIMNNRNDKIQDKIKKLYKIKLKKTNRI